MMGPVFSLTKQSDGVLMLYWKIQFKFPFIWQY